MEWYTVLAAGWSVLVAAIIANVAANALGLATWYPYIQSITETGFLTASKDAGIASLLFLYVVYPVILGFTPLYVAKLIS